MEETIMNIETVMNTQDANVITVVEGGKDYVISESHRLEISVRLYLERFRNSRINPVPTLPTSKKDINDLLSYFKGDTYKIGLLYSKSENYIKKVFCAIVLNNKEFYNMYIVQNLSYADIVSAVDSPVVTRDSLKNRNRILGYKKSTENTMQGIRSYLNDSTRITEAKTKRYNTNIERYGVRVPLQNKSIVSNMKKTNLSRYGVDNVKKVKLFSDKQAISTSRRWGSKYYTDSLEYRASRITDKFTPTAYVKTPLQAVKLLTNQEDGSISTSLKDLLTDIGHSRYTVGDIAAIVGVPKKYLNGSPNSPAYIHVSLNSAVYTSRHDKESEVADYIKSLGYSPIVNKMYPELDNQQLDVYIPEQRLGIEFNGTYFHATEGSVRGKPKNYHKIKTQLAREHMGITLFHIWEYDWENPVRKDIIKSQLAYKLHDGLVKKVYARKTIIRPITPKQSVQFFDENHIQGGNGSTGTYRYGLFLDDELVCAMTFGKRYTGNYDWELIRFANKKYTTVVGGASKLFSFFYSLHKGDKIISYENNDFGLDVGQSMYTKLGFTKTGTTEPGYHWVNHTNVVNRQKTMPKNLVKYTKGTKVAPFIGASQDFRINNPKETESEYMTKNGFVRVYNAGNDIYTYQKD